MKQETQKERMCQCWTRRPIETRSQDDSRAFPYCLMLENKLSRLNLEAAMSIYRLSHFVALGSVSMSMKLSGVSLTGR